MKKKLLILFGLTHWFLAHSQKIDSVYYIHVISNEDQGPLPFTFITISGIRQGETDQQGMIKLKREQLFRHAPWNSSVQMEARAMGFKVQKFSSDMLVLHDTLELFMEKNPIVLKEVEIVSYKVPFIDPDYYKKKIKECKGIKDSTISYSAKEIKDYVLIVKNKWTVADSLRNQVTAGYSDWHDYLIKLLYYPPKAREWDIQGKVYFSFELDDKGYVRNIKLLKTSNPLFAIEVMNQLSKMPRIMINKNYDQPPRPLEYLLTVSFQLKN